MIAFPLRLLPALFSAALLAAQNPLAMAADPFGGTFKNDQMKLELVRKGNEYGGAFLLDGNSMPVKARVHNGKLEGTFQSQGKTYAFQATRAGTNLTLTTEGVTHSLEKEIPVPAASPVIGAWQGPNFLVRINADGTAAIGDKIHRWTADGDVVTFTGNGESLRVPFEIAGDTWTWKLPEGRVALTRTSGIIPVAPAATAAPAAPAENGITGSWQGPNGTVQLNLDGSAMVAGIVYRYSLAGDKLTLGGPDGTFVAIVKQSGDTMTWLVNGKTLNFQRSAALWSLGSSKTGEILPELIGKWCRPTSEDRKACFTLLADGSFLFDSDVAETGTWTATSDSFTTTSRKAGSKTYRVEKRNHAQTGEPLLILDGSEFSSAYPKSPWR